MSSTSTPPQTFNITDIATFCCAKGFIYPSSEIYNGYGGYWDYGPYGVELLTNLKASFLNFFVRNRVEPSMFSLDASIISHPRVWQASGHLDNFGDALLACSNEKCGVSVRADHYIEDQLKINCDGLEYAQMKEYAQKLRCPQCSSTFGDLKQFNLLCPTRVGTNSTSYLRGETAQGMFLNFKNVVQTCRAQLPFGICQVGKCFRNEISPRDFIFRSREFHIAELEFFVNPNETKCTVLNDEKKNLELKVLTAEIQQNGKSSLQTFKVEDLVKLGKLDEWHAYWLTEQIEWLIELGLDPAKLKVREHMKTELSHYSNATFDIDYQFPFGSKEIGGIADRGTFDLTSHSKHSGKDLSIFDMQTKERVMPRVVEPTFGIERIVLALICENLKYDVIRKYMVLSLKPSLSPIKFAILPLIKKRHSDFAKVLFKTLKSKFMCTLDAADSIGRRYARQDELGTPFCLTIDHDSLSQNDVTLRDRDTQKQVRVGLGELEQVLLKLL